MSSSSTDWTVFWALVFGLAVGSLLWGVIAGQVIQRRERKRIQAFFAPEHTANVADLEEHRWKRRRQRLQALLKRGGGDDNAA